MGFTSGISLAAIEDQKEYKKKTIGLLLAAFIGTSILVLGFFVSVKSNTDYTISQNTQESYCKCFGNCSCEISCCCH